MLVSQADSCRMAVKDTNQTLTIAVLQILDSVSLAAGLLAAGLLAAGVMANHKHTVT